MAFPNDDTKFKAGESGNPNGRPRKYVSQLREIGYKLSEINDTIQVMMAMDMEELKSVWDNPKATVLEKTRVYGKPRENADVKTEMTIRLIDDDDTPTEAARSTDTGAE